jgi:hypothetical protein
MSVEELENAVSKLTRQEIADFAHWFDEYRAELWDRQIESDAQAGRFSALGEKADADFESGQCTPL